MKKKFTAYLLGLCLMLPMLVHAQRTKDVRSEVKEVTLFTNRAQLTSTAKTTVETGLTDLVLDNLPTNIDEQSLQVDARGNVVIYGVRFEQNYLNNSQEPKELRMLEDSLTSYQNELRMLTDQREILQKEENMIMANQQIGGQKGVDVVELEDMADFFRGRLTSIRSKLLMLDLKVKKMQSEVIKYQSQLNQYNSSNSKATGQVVVTVQAESRTTVELAVNYLVQQAGWQPVYDIRVRDTQEPVKLHYKAMITQNTGINWQNVKLTLSSGSPSTAGAVKPQLQPWHLHIGAPHTGATYTNEAVRVKGIRNRSIDGLADAVKMESAATLADYTSVSQSVLSVEYEIGVPFSVPSDGKAHTVDIQQHSLKASYQYMVVPKLSSDVLLMAQLTDWENLDLLPGNANIFYQGTFTGKAFFNLNNTTDTLSFVLGQDKKVVVTRERIKDFKSKSLFGSNVKEAFGYEITVRNTKPEAINLKIEDQVPLSSNSKIEVETEDLSGGSHNKETGTVTWNLNLKPAETKKLQLKYTVKYPKGAYIVNL